MRLQPASSTAELFNFDNSCKGVDSQPFLLNSTESDAEKNETTTEMSSASSFSHNGFLLIRPFRLLVKWSNAIWKRLSHHISGRRIFFYNLISSAFHHFRHGLIFRRRCRYGRIDFVGSTSAYNWARHTVTFHQTWHQDRRSDDCVTGVI